jgi:hypothetical protein
LGGIIGGVEQPLGAKRLARRTRERVSRGK